jgi:cell division transport system permease protein
MALSVDYVVRETAANLRRNLLMTVAAVLTVAVSLSLVGGALLLKQGVARATLRWRGGVELSIFLDPKASPSQAAAIEQQLATMPDLVKKFTYYDHDAAYNEFKQMFANSPDELASISPADLPTSYRIVPKRAEDAALIGARFKDAPGVSDIALAQKTVDTLLKVTRALQIGILSVAAVLLLSASLLILNTIRIAIFARRREVAVMKLVGATNWFIRVPFMLEGMVQGLLGALAAFGIVLVLRGLVEHAVRHYDLGLFDQLVVPTHDAINTGIFVLLVGGIVGAVGSAVAVRRFLDV